MGKWKELAQPDDIHTCHADCQNPACVAVRQAAEIHTCTPDFSKAGFGKPQREEGCAECGKQASEGWALYCVKCIEPVREWQGLTDEEREEATGWSVEHIEAKLKEKNHGNL